MLRDISNYTNTTEAMAAVYPHHIFKCATEAVIDLPNGETARQRLDDNFAIMRDDGKELGKCGQGYHVLQPSTVFEAYQPWLDSGLITLDKGGDLSDGRKIVVTAAIKDAEAEIIKGDYIKKYVLMATSFDGSISTALGTTNSRQACLNILMATLKNDASTLTKIKHTATQQKKFDAAVSFINKELENFREEVEQYRYLATKQVTRKEQEKYILQLFAPEALEGTEISTKKQNIVDRITLKLDTQRGMDLVPAIRGTAWQAYNAVTEYLTHDYGRNEDSRLNALYFGESAKMNNQALKQALTM